MLVENVLWQLFGDKHFVIKSSSKTIMMVVSRTVVYGAIAKVPQSSTFQLAVKGPLYETVLEPFVMDAISI